MTWLDRAAAWLDGPEAGSPEAAGWLRRHAGALAVAAVAWLVLLRLRDAGLYPTVLSDELRYSLAARHQPLSAAAVPSQLFFGLFSITRACGDGFLECARGLNAALLLLAVPLLYSVSRTVASPRASALVAAQAVLGPFGTYAAYFMPECLYFLGVWLLVWFLLRVAPRAAWQAGAGAGAILGLLAMVKMNALFLFLGLAGFWAWGALLGVRPLGRGGPGPLLLATLGAFAVVRLGGGYLLGGEQGLHLVGAYSHLVGDISRTKSPGWALPEVGWLLGMHGLGLVLLFAVPLGLLLAPRGARGPGALPPALRSVEGLLLAFLAPLVLISVVFTVAVVGLAPYEVVSRLHLRYYNFLFPLFSILAAGHLSHARRDVTAASRPLQRAVLALLLVPLAVGCWTGLEGTITYLPDAPELEGLRTEPWVLRGLGLLGLLTLALAAAAPRRGLALQVLVLGPLLAGLTSVRATLELRDRLQPQVADTAGAYARQALGPLTSTLVVAGPRRDALYRALFQVDDPAARWVDLPEGQALEGARIPAGARWVLYLGDHPAARPPAGPPTERGFTLVPLGP